MSAAELMKTLIAFPVMLMFGAAAWAQQSLGDVARQTRSQQKSPAIVRFDDDSLRRSAITDDTKPADDTNDDSKKDDSKKAGENGKTPEGTKKEKPKAEDWTAKIEDQRKEIATLQRELDIL